MYRGGEGTTPLTTACMAEGKTSYELSWKVKVMMKEKKGKKGRPGGLLVVVALECYY